jgi:amidohydrolase family protein
MRLLPEGEAVLSRESTMALPAGAAGSPAGGTAPPSAATVASGGDAPAATLYRIAGLDFEPVSVWLGDRNGLDALISDDSATLPAAWLPALDRLHAGQAGADRAWTARLARESTDTPGGELVIRDARLFDPRDLSLRPHMSVRIRADRVLQTAADGEVAVPAGARVIDAHGRVLLPGLWDNHQHFSDAEGALDLANGITSARDMANDTEEFPRRVARFDDGTELGPRVFKAGIIDGRGPLAAPTRVLADTSAEAIQDVDWYADHGYGQIKIYSSVKPELVPIIADEAHARGLRVSGHVPAFMSAQQFIEGGADEMQHLNFVVLNFLAASVPDTRGMARFTAVAEHARDLGPERPEVREFIEMLNRRHIVLDPTVNVFESLFQGKSGAPAPGLEALAPRLPLLARRRAMAEALPVPAEHVDAYAAAFPALLRLLKAIDAAGVTVIPGTDSFAGYSLIHELELYQRAGIDPRHILEMATLTSARVIGADRDRGCIAAGKLADMILVDGDPTEQIGALHRIDLVIKGGRLYVPSNIERGLGIRARE